MAASARRCAVAFLSVCFTPSLSLTGGWSQRQHAGCPCLRRHSVLRIPKTAQRRHRARAGALFNPNSIHASGLSMGTQIAPRRRFCTGRRNNISRQLAIPTTCNASAGRACSGADIRDGQAKAVPFPGGEDRHGRARNWAGERDCSAATAPSPAPLPAHALLPRIEITCDTLLRVSSVGGAQTPVRATQRVSKPRLTMSQPLSP